MKPKKTKPEAPPPPPPPTPQRDATSHETVRDRAMLVRLRVNAWLGKASDQIITEDVVKRHNIDKQMACEVRKSLLPKDALFNLQLQAYRLRNLHNRFTLPWDDSGTRMLKATAFDEYNRQVTAAIAKYEQVFHDEFEMNGATGVPKYDEFIATAKTLLNGAWRAEDYPTLPELKKKFGAKIKINAIPKGEDFRIDLGAEVTANVRREIEDQLTTSLNEALQVIYANLKATVSKLVEALKSPEGKAVRSTLLKSINAVLETLPFLNIADDPTVDAFGAEIRQMLAGLDAKTLRKEESVRVDVSAKAEAILDRMQEFLS